MRDKSFVNRLVILAAILSLTTTAFAAKVIDERHRIPMATSEPSISAGALDLGPAEASLPLDHMLMVLQRPAEKQAALESLLADQQDPASPNFHRWLTPDEFGVRFGAAPGDVAQATSWLESHDFAIDEVASGLGWISFSGTVGQVEDAFQTEIHSFAADGTVRHASVGTPSLPRALARITAGVLSLHDIPKKGAANFRTEHSPSPQFTNSDGSHYLAPADFAMIYNSQPLVAAGTDGTGQTIAVVGRTDINPADVTYFRSFFGLPAASPVIVHNGAAPGNLGGDEELEGLLDVEWAGAVAPGATVQFIISKSTSSTDGIDLSAAYAVDHNVAPVLSVSFLNCEKALGTSGNTFYKNLWSQAAAQGITVAVCTGDSGAADCDNPDASKGGSPSVSGLSSTAYNVAVGGTQFADASGSAYWSPTTAYVTQESAIGYIPEVVWNESAAVSGGQGLWATGGGMSSVNTRPSWQSVPGVAAEGRRTVPDVSFSASYHDGHLMIQGHTDADAGFVVAYGTSVAAPSMAGVVALLVQANGGRLGNINQNLYRLATNQYGFNGTPMFHDVMTGNNSVPGTNGYEAAVGYDAASGIGSIDVAALAAGWNLQTATVGFSSGSAIGDRKNGAVALTVTRAGYLAGASTVTFATKGLTAASGRDYVGTSGSLTFGPGETTRTISITLLAVSSAPSRQFDVVLEQPLAGSTLGASPTLTVTLPALSPVTPQAPNREVGAVSSATLTPSSGRH